MVIFKVYHSIYFINVVFSSKKTSFKKDHCHFDKINIETLGCIIFSTSSLRSFKSIHQPNLQSSDIQHFLLHIHSLLGPLFTNQLQSGPVNVPLRHSSGSPPFFPSQLQRHSYIPSPPSIQPATFGTPVSQ